MKIAYIVGKDAAPSEQFIAREIGALRQLGAEIAVYPVECGAGSSCPWCVLGEHLWLSCLPRTWRAISRFPFAELAALRPRVWREFVGGIGMASQYARDIEARGIERIHAHFATKPAAVGMMIAAILDLPFTLSGHARDVFTDGVALRHKVRAAEHTVLCTRAALDELLATLPKALHERLVVIRHGLDRSEFEFRSGWTPHLPVRLLAAGRFVEKKGFGVLIEAMCELGECVCEIVGAGALDRDLRGQADRLGVCDRVTFSGWLSQEALRAKMSASDMLVAPSVVGRDGDRDGVPNVLLEAAALGVPLIACDSGGIGEFVVNCETGRLVAAGDPELLVGAVRSTLATPETTRRFAENARKKVETEYDLRENARLLLDLFTRPVRGAR